jgi:virginiamycin B lyase
VELAVTGPGGRDHPETPMHLKSLLILTTAASLGAVLLAHSQGVQPTPGVPGDYALPDGNAKGLIQENCTICHNLRNVVNSNKSAEDWDNTVDMMKAAGAPITAEQAGQIKAYLIANFPEKPRPQPAHLAGPVQVKFQIWKTPTPGSRPHDPLATPDGMLWWSGQFANRLGRLDPKTGEAKEFPIPIRGGPHGLINDKDGNIWYGGNWGGHIGELIVKTGEFKFYPMPDPRARDPHTPLFDKDGILWFSVQNGGFMGRLDPKTGEIKLFQPTGPSGQQPYALRILSDGTPWFSFFGANKLASIDPVTLQVKEHTLPDPRTRIRRMTVTSDDMIWYGDWVTGKLSRFEPKTGWVTEWQSPSGPQSQPYGMTAIDDKIWYVESNTRPNNLVRFDPKTENFQTFEIPGGGGIVRHMVPTPDGQLAMAMSGLSTVGIAEILPASSN